MAARAKALTPTLRDPFEAQVVGHESLLAQLGASVAEGRPIPGSVFVGPPGVGKRTCALWFARALFCEAPVGGRARPCGMCGQCRRVLSGTHPDIYELVREEGRAQIRMEQVTDLLHAAEYAPLEASHRVFLLSEAHLANSASMNALLKVLEEPRPDQVFVLTVPSTRAVLPTILSRCQTLRFSPLPTPKVAAWLAARAEHPERGELAASLSEGRPGIALRLLSDARYWQARETVLKLAVRVGQGTDAMTIAEDVEASLGSDKRVDLERVLGFLTAWYRDVLWRARGLDPQRVLNVDHRAALEEIAPRFTPDRAQGALAALDAAREHLQRNVNPKLLLARLCLRLRP